MRVPHRKSVTALVRATNVAPHVNQGVGLLAETKGVAFPAAAEFVQAAIGQQEHDSCFRRATPEVEPRSNRA